MTVEIVPATGDRFDAAEHALTGGGDGASCQCQWWMLTNAVYNASSRAERTQMLRDELENSSPPPALIAYVDGEPAGWVRVGPRTSQPRLARTREVANNTAEPLDDDGVWSVSCFVVRKEFRRRGLSAILLNAAVEAARVAGARVVEAYPDDLAGGKKPANQLYRGVLPVFEAAGFEVVVRPKPGRALVSLAL